MDKQKFDWTILYGVINFIMFILLNAVIMILMSIYVQNIIFKIVAMPLIIYVCHIIEEKVIMPLINPIITVFIPKEVREIEQKLKGKSKKEIIKLANNLNKNK